MTSWDQDKCLELLSEFHKNEILWNPNHKSYYDNVKKELAWKDISEIMSVDVEEIKKKMESLRGSFRRERNRERKGIRAGNIARKSVYCDFRY